MRILVTGADGFLGSHIARGLEGAGHEVVRSVFARPAKDASELWVDLTRAESLLQLPARADVVVHAAGSVDVRAPRSRMFAANLRTTELLLGWARRAQVAHFVQLSSVAVYGPRVLGEERSESTARFGLHVGSSYMRSKARAELLVEQSGLPFTLLRPPAVIGHGDGLVSRGFRDALTGAGIPLLPGAREQARVSLLLAPGLAEIVRLSLLRGALNGPLHAVDQALTFGALARIYARALGRPCRFVQVPWRDAYRFRNEASVSWLLASARFGQHYRSDRLLTELGYVSTLDLELAVEDGLSGLQGGPLRLF